MLFMVLITCGSVHKNPGPGKQDDSSILYICHVNMHSLCLDDRSTKLDEMHQTLAVDQKFSIIGVRETWLDESISDNDVTLPNYQIFRNDRNRHGVGVAIYCHNDLAIKALPDFSFDGIESVAVELKLCIKSIFIICCYRPPGATAAEVDTF